MLGNFKTAVVSTFVFIILICAYSGFSEEKPAKAKAKPSGEVKVISDDPSLEGEDAEEVKTDDKKKDEVKKEDNKKDQVEKEDKKKEEVETGKEVKAGKEAEPAVKKEEKKEKEINISTEEIFALKEEYLEEKKNLKGPSAGSLVEIVKKYVAEADAEYELKKKSGNTRGMAIAREAKKVFSTCLEELEKDGKMTMPENFRKDLTEKIDKFKVEVKPILDETEKTIAEFDGKYFEKFSELMNPLIEEAKIKGEEKDAALKKYYGKFCNEEIKPAASTDPAEGTTGDKNGKVQSSVIGTKGFGDTWVDVGEWIGEMQGEDVVNIKISSIDDYTEDQPNPMTGNDSKLTYKVIYPVPPRSDYAFRIVKMPDKYKVEILEWPSPANDMTLVVRTQAIAEVPAVHGLIVQASLPANEIYKVFNKDTIKKPADQNSEQNPEVTKNTPKKNEVKKIVIEFVSTPPNATIYLDHLVQNGKDGFPIKTPCKIQVEPGTHTMNFVKLGYLDKILEDYSLTKPKKVTVELERDPKVTFKKYQLGANSSSEKPTGVNLKKGQKFIINATGKWRCMSKDACDAFGYPNILKYYDLYMDNVKYGRVTDKANFGALIYKIGKKGVFFTYKEGEMLDVPEDGELIFDVNVRPRDRKDNSGMLDMDIIVFSDKGS